MILKIAKFLSACPYLMGERINVNFLAQSDAAVSIMMTQTRKTVKEYADGGRLDAAVFVLALRESFGVDDSENKRIAEKCSNIERWIEEQSLSGSLPELAKDEAMAAIGIVKSFHMVRTDSMSARYEAELEVIYYAD